MDGWNTTFLLGRPIFRGYVSFREGTLQETNIDFTPENQWFLERWSISFWGPLWGLFNFQGRTQCISVSGSGFPTTRTSLTEVFPSEVDETCRHGGWRSRNPTRIHHSWNTRDVNPLWYCLPLTKTGTWWPSDYKWLFQLDDFQISKFDIAEIAF